MVKADGGTSWSAIHPGTPRPPAPDRLPRLPGVPFTTIGEVIDKLAQPASTEARPGSN